MYDEDQVCGGSCDYVGNVDFVPFLKAEKRVVPPSEPCAALGSPISLRTGDYTFQTADLSLASVASDLEMIRTYHAQDGFDGPLGPGWSMAYFIQAISTQQGDNTQVIIRVANPFTGCFHRQLVLGAHTVPFPLGRRGGYKKDCRLSGFFAPPPVSER